jgi:hypothetical protein
VTTTFTLGDELPATWSPPDAEAGAADLVAAQAAAAEPEPEAPVPFTITSNPVGARVIFDGEELAEATPATVDVDLAGEHSVQVALDGYETTSWRFGRDDLNESQLQERELMFALTPSTPPGFVEIDNPGYPVAVTISPREGGRPQSVAEATSHNIRLMPGNYTVELSAPSVFLANERRNVTIESGQTFTLPALPRAVTVQVAAVPGNCIVSVDGREVGPTPFPLQIVVGTHQFTFDWSAIGQGSKNVSVSINSNGQRVVEQAGGSR